MTAQHDAQGQLRSDSGMVACQGSCSALGATPDQLGVCCRIAPKLPFARLGWSTIGLTGLLFSCLLVNYSEEICRCIFDIEVFVLASPALCSENAAAMDIFEIAIWRFVMPPTFFSVLVVYRQEPLSVLGEAVLFDEFFSVYVDG